MVTLLTVIVHALTRCSNVSHERRMFHLLFLTVKVTACAASCYRSLNLHVKCLDIQHATRSCIARCFVLGMEGPALTGKAWRWSLEERRKDTFSTSRAVCEEQKRQRWKVLQERVAFVLRSGPLDSIYGYWERGGFRGCFCSGLQCSLNIFNGGCMTFVSHSWLTSAMRPCLNALLKPV